MIGDNEQNQPSVASSSSSSMTDENSSTGAVLGSPATRSFSTTHESQESSQNPTYIAPNLPQPSSSNQQPSESDPRASRQQYPYLTDYETTTNTEHQEYPTSLSVSQELYSTSPPQTQTRHAEDQAGYVQTSSLPAMTYGPPYVNPDPQIHQPRSAHQNPYYTPPIITPTQHPVQHTSDPSYDPYPYATPIAQPFTQPVDYGEPAQAPYTHYGQSPYENFYTPANALAVFPPFYSNPFQAQSELEGHNQQPAGQLPYLQKPVSALASASEPLNRYVTSDNEESWSPAAQANSETHKRRISEADETVDGFKHNKMRNELDELGEVRTGSQEQTPRKRRRRARRGRGRGKAREREGSRSRDGGDGKGKNERGWRGRGTPAAKRS